jgi:hypothetical protein
MTRGRTGRRERRCDDTAGPNRGIRVFIVLSEIEIVLDERSADEGVVADTIAADPGIEEREGEQENEAQEKLRLPGAICGRCAEVVQADR